MKENADSKEVRAGASLAGDASVFNVKVSGHDCNHVVVIEAYGKYRTVWPTTVLFRKQFYLDLMHADISLVESLSGFFKPLLILRKTGPFVRFTDAIEWHKLYQKVKRSGRKRMKQTDIRDLEYRFQRLCDGEFKPFEVAIACR